MMNENQLSSDVLQLMGEKYKEILGGYRSIDQAFIDRGFITVQAAMERDQKVYGKSCYERMVYEVIHPECIDEWRDKQDNIVQMLYGEYECNGKKTPKKYFKEILLRDDLSCYAKKDLLQRFYPDFLDERLAVYQLMLHEKALEEKKRLCKIWWDRPVERLLDNQSIPLRKEVFNSVIADAFGVYGFVKRSRKRGLDIYHKLINEQYAIVVEVDYKTLVRVSQDLGPDFDIDVHGGLGLDWIYSVASADKKNNMVFYYFRPFYYAYSDGCLRFRDTQSLEISIRAAALNYELTIAPFEDVIRDSSKIQTSKYKKSGLINTEQDSIRNKVDMDFPIDDTVIGLVFPKNARGLVNTLEGQPEIRSVDSLDTQWQVAQLEESAIPDFSNMPELPPLGRKLLAWSRLTPLMIFVHAGDFGWAYQLFVDGKVVAMFSGYGNVEETGFESIIDKAHPEMFDHLEATPEQVKQLHVLFEPKHIEAVRKNHEDWKLANRFRQILGLFDMPIIE